jgi:hypothetical protein
MIFSSLKEQGFQGATTTLTQFLAYWRPEEAIFPNLKEVTFWSVKAIFPNLKRDAFSQRQNNLHASSCDMAT